MTDGAPGERVDRLHASNHTMSPKPNDKSASRPKPAVTKPDEMDPELLEFIQAIDDYKRIQGRPFPHWSEVLEIIKDLGYERVSRD